MQVWLRHPQQNKWSHPAGRLLRLHWILLRHIIFRPADTEQVGTLFFLDVQDIYVRFVHRFERPVSGVYTERLSPVNARHRDTVPRLCSVNQGLITKHGHIVGCLPLRDGIGIFLQGQHSSECPHLSDCGVMADLQGQEGRGRKAGVSGQNWHVQRYLTPAREN